MLYVFVIVIFKKKVLTFLDNLPYIFLNVVYIPTGRPTCEDNRCHKAGHCVDIVYKNNTMCLKQNQGKCVNYQPGESKQMCYYGICTEVSVKNYTLCVGVFCAPFDTSDTYLCLCPTPYSGRHCESTYIHVYLRKKYIYTHIIQMNFT